MSTIWVLIVYFTPYLLLFARWKAQPVSLYKEDHGYSLVSDYYKRKLIKGVWHYKITAKGVWKLDEGQLNDQTHNFMVYLFGHGELKHEDYPC